MSITDWMWLKLWHIVIQGNHSFSTMIFHDFSMTKNNEFPWHDLSVQHIFRNDTWFMNAYQNKITFPVARRNYCHKTRPVKLQTGRYLHKNSMHFFKKKIPGHHHHFPWLSMTLAVFHNLPGLENCINWIPWLFRNSGHPGNFCTICAIFECLHFSR